MKINISEIATENVLSEVEVIKANGVIGGGGASINFDFLFQDGGPGAANADINFEVVGVTQDIDQPANHSALLAGSLQLGDN